MMRRAADSWLSGESGLTLKSDGVLKLLLVERDALMQTCCGALACRQIDVLRCPCTQGR